MKQIRMFTIVVALLFATGTFAQSSPRHYDTNQGSGQGVGQSQGRSASYGMPTVEEQVKLLTGKLNLTTEQQARIKPIMQELHDATLKLMQDEKLSHEERLDRVRPLRYSADKKIRVILDDDQKKKLDQYLQGPHHEMHGDLEGKHNHRHSRRSRVASLSRPLCLWWLLAKANHICQRAQETSNERSS